MARICINIIREGRPTIVEEDIELAAQHAGLGDEIDIIDQGDGRWTVDIYDRRSVSSEQVGRSRDTLMNPPTRKLRSSISKIGRREVGRMRRGKSNT